MIGVRCCLRFGIMRLRVHYYFAIIKATLISYKNTISKIYLSGFECLKIAGVAHKTIKTNRRYKKRSKQNSISIGIVVVLISVFLAISRAMVEISSFHYAEKWRWFIVLQSQPNFITQTCSTNSTFIYHLMLAPVRHLGKSSKNPKKLHNKWKNT